jgi:hypothetical protein
MEEIKMSNTKITGLQIGIIVLTVATALIHLSLNFPNFDVMFTLNGLGYLGLLTALFLPMPLFTSRRGLIRFVLMAFAAVAIIAWIAIGEKDISKGYIAYLGYTDKIIEIVLIILLWLENQRSKS